MRRVAFIAVLLLWFAPVAVLTAAAPVLAATITVTTTADIVNGGDGLISLREAVTTANGAGEPSTIELTAATYTVDLCGADENANANGDLDSTAAHVLTIAGGGATVEQTCTGQRILHAINPLGGLVLEALTLTGGDQTIGAAVAWANDLDLTGVTVAGNDAGGGSVLSSDDAFASGPTLDLAASMVGPNTGTGVRIAFGSVTIIGSTLSGNSLRGVGLIDGALSVADSVVQDNGTGGLNTTGQGEGLLTVANTEVTGNGGPGVGCSACGSVEITDSQIVGNAGGIVVNVDQDEATDELYVNVDGSTVADNIKTGAGAGLGVFIIELSDDAPAAQITVTRSTFSGNQANGAGNRGGAIFAVTGEVRVDNSTLHGNSSDATGGGIYTSTGDVFLRHATVTGNTAAVGSNIGTGEDLNSFGSIVAQGMGAIDECAIAGTTISDGYNIGGDLSCAFVEGPGDQTNVGDPMLGTLQDNGGQTLTRLPAAGSPAEGAIPAAACTVFAVDQRGVTRPQGLDCESGSVEFAEALPVPMCTKTGTTGPDVLTGGSGEDVLCGLGGDDILLGMGGRDTLIGGPGDDILLGGAGDDTLRGNEGNDLLVGGPGHDDLAGGPGTDVCVGDPAPFRSC